MDPTAERNLERFLELNRTNGRSENTIRAYRADIKGFYEHFEPDMTLTQTLAAIPVYLNEIRYSQAASTVKRKVVTLRSFGQLLSGNKDFMSQYRAPVVAPGKAHPLPGGMDDVRKMLAATRRPHHRALVCLTGVLGLRISEALNVRASHLTDDDGGISLLVRGKGDKTRDVPVSTAAMIELTPAYEISILNDDDRLVPIHDRAARRYLTRLGARVGVARPVASHDMRHTFGTAVYEKSKDIRATQELLGHSSVETTQVYTGVSSKAKRSAADV